jgi:nucleoside 2-deoxyribosyltransferase
METEKRKIIVYLAGGMHTAWREDVKMSFEEEVMFIDPTDHGLSSESGYTLVDKVSIRACDFVFAFMEETNPSGVGLAYEIGFAAGLNKPVIFVDNSKEDVKKYFGMCRVSSAAHTESFSEGIKMLRYLIAAKKTLRNAL